MIAPTVTRVERPIISYEDERPHMQEAGRTQVYKMIDTSSPVELHDTGLTPFSEVLLRRGLGASPSVTSHSSRDSINTENSFSAEQSIAAPSTTTTTSATSGRLDFAWTP